MSNIEVSLASGNKWFSRDDQLHIYDHRKVQSYCGLKCFQEIFITKDSFPKGWEKQNKFKICQICLNCAEHSDFIWKVKSWAKDVGNKREYIFPQRFAECSGCHGHKCFSFMGFDIYDGKLAREFSVIQYWTKQSKDWDNFPPVDTICDCS